MSVIRSGIVLAASMLTACVSEGELGEDCDGNVLFDVHCADGLVCDDSKGFTCQPEPTSDAATASPSTPPTPSARPSLPPPSNPPRDAAGVDP